jgi:alkanesulfonate monooxygenase SsuD/methylene tetrahydromethanopterin reductase-like flavin-dependent oxidoreductase (luciferase family)
MAALQFGVNVPTSAGDGADPVGDARRAEELGYDFVSSSDHPGASSPNYETWTMLTWIAASTSRIGIATRVLGVPFRPPALLAKMAATLDALSGGRFILGLGGGSGDEEFRGFGLGLPSPREKTDGLEDAVTIIRGLWSEPGFTYQGRRYSTEEAEHEPKPDRHIPIWLGTYAPRALAVTGRLADGWIPSLGYADPDDVPAMRERILGAARKAGRDPAEITCVFNVEVRIDGAADDESSVISGSADEVAERLTGFLGLGFSVLNFMPPLGPEYGEQVERLAREVIPAVRSSVESQASTRS